MSQDRRWLLGGLAVVFGFVGLFLASRAGHGIFYWIGLIVFLAAVGTIFGFVRAAFDEAEGKAQTPQHLVPLTMLAVAVGSVVFHFLSPWWWSPIASNWGYIDQTIIITFWITGVAFTAIVVFLAYCLYRFGHQAGRRAAYEPESRRLEFWLTMGTAAGVVAMLAPGLIVWSQFVTVPEEAAEIEIVGQQWQWSFRYPGEDGRLGRSDTRLVSNDNPLGLDPNDPNGADDVVVQNVDLRLPVDRPLKVLLRSLDVLHDFYVPEFRAKMDMIPGTVTYFWVEPTRTGTFDILCAELCGVGHAYMRGRVEVMEESQYQAWLQQQPTFAALANGYARVTSRSPDGGEASARSSVR